MVCRNVKQFLANCSNLWYFFWAPLKHSSEHPDIFLKHFAQLTLLFFISAMPLWIIGASIEKWLSYPNDKVPVIISCLIAAACIGSSTLTQQAFLHHFMIQSNMFFIVWYVQHCPALKMTNRLSLLMDKSVVPAYGLPIYRSIMFLVIHHHHRQSHPPPL